jgi:hypothetical protein
MKILKSALLSLFALACPAVWAEPPSVPSPTTPDLLAEALPILQAKYVDFKALNYKPGDTLNDLITRSDGKISVKTPEIGFTPFPILTTPLTATLPDDTLYWRLASFARPPGKKWPDLAAELKQASVSGVILDLRSNSTPDDYEGAEQILSILRPAPTPPKALETIDDSRSEPLVIPPLIVILINGRTVGSAEALAGFLQADGALVVGRTSAGQVGIFQEDTLSSGQVLRYAATGPDPALVFKFRSQAPRWGQPIVPDLALTVDDQNERAALTLIKDNQISEVIQESAERHRLSEAALVQGQDPEFDDYLASLERHPVLLSLPVVHDTVLISALDSLKAIRLSQRPLPAEATANASLPSSTSVQ